MFDAYLYTGVNLDGIKLDKAMYKDPYMSIHEKCGGLFWHLPKGAIQLDLRGLRRYLGTDETKKLAIIGADPWWAAYELQKLGIKCPKFAVGNLTAVKDNIPEIAMKARYTRESGHGSPRRISELDFEIRYGNTDSNPLLRITKQLSPHLRTDNLLSLIANIGDPRWFASVYDPYGARVLLAYLGLSETIAEGVPDIPVTTENYAGYNAAEFLALEGLQDRRQLVLDCIDFEALMQNIMSPNLSPEHDYCPLTALVANKLVGLNEEEAELFLARFLVRVLVHNWYVVMLSTERRIRYNEFVDPTLFDGMVSEEMQKRYFHYLEVVLS